MSVISHHLSDVTEMLGFRKNSESDEGSPPGLNGDVAKLFFDTFSGKLRSLEANLRLLTADVERLKISGDQSKLSDLVLLERLQKTEKIVGESLTWIKQIADTVLGSPTPASTEVKVIEPAPNSTTPSKLPQPQLVLVPPDRHDPSVVQPGSLNWITTPTELQVLTLLANEGPKSAPEIGRVVGRSREHSARLMKKLFDEGYVRRDQTRIPFRYSTIERLKNSLTKRVEKDSGQEVASAPPA